MNKYRLMHGASPLGYCSVCAVEAQKWIDGMADSENNVDVKSKYGQTAFREKDAAVIQKGGDYLGTLIAASW